MANKISAERLREVLNYDPTTGVFTRRVALGRHGCHRAGEVCGTKTTRGYVFICVDGCKSMAHRLAWLYVYGVWPKGDLDHINQQKDDNRIANLREVTRPQNMHNVTLHKHNSSGYKGVAWHKQRNCWRAYIFINYKQKHIGLFPTKEAAAEARRQAEIDYRVLPS